MWVALIATVITGALLYKLLFSKPNNHWKKLGIPEIDTSSVVGILDVLLGRKMMTAVDDYAYSQMGPNDKFCRIMEVNKPVIIIKDTELLKKVLIKDFDHFVDRRSFFTEEDGIIFKMLVNLKGDEWKGVRTAVSPTFTTGKIRRMMSFFNVVGKDWVREYTRKATSDPSGSTKIDVVKAVNQYTVEVISTTVFGMKADAIKNPDSTFFKMALRVSNPNKALMAKFALRMNFPRLSRFLGFPLLDQEVVTFFEKILEQALRSRVSGVTKRNDFLQLLVEAKKGELKAAERDELSTFEKDAQISPDSIKKMHYLSEHIMTAQSIIFFLAGFSTTTNFITFALCTLALRPEVQEKLRQEVDKIVKENGDLDYDDIGQLVYMDMFVCEVLRMYPAALRLERICTKDYKDPESGLVVSKGTMVVIPLNAIHNDKQYYDNPEEFDPEHFSPEKKAARSRYAFMPFGMGPRNCIGMRFALIEVKSAIAHMVHSFNIEPTEKTPTALHYQPCGFQVLPPKNLQLKLTPINAKK